MHVCLGGKSGGREGEDEQHRQRAHSRQQGTRRAERGGMPPEADAAEGHQESQRGGGVLSLTRLSTGASVLKEP